MMLPGSVCKPGDMFIRSLIVLYAAQSTAGATTATVSASQSRVISRVCDPAGLEQHPPTCWQQRAGGPSIRGAEAAVGAAQRHLPSKYGGSATVGQCVFGHPEAVNGIFGGGQSCWTGALFGFSGVDGPCPEDFECTNNQFFGWFVNGSYSLWIDTPTPRHLRLGFGPELGADATQDTVLVATNDVLLVQRGASRLGLTWLDWRTMVGFVEGPDAHFQLEELTGQGHSTPGGCAVGDGCCNAVKQFSLSPLRYAYAPAHRYWRWEIDKSHDGAGSTICYIGFNVDGRWTTDPSWNVSALYHSFDGGGAPSGLLTRDCNQCLLRNTFYIHAKSWTNLVSEPATCACFGPAIFAPCAPIWLEMFEPDWGAESCASHSKHAQDAGLGQPYDP